jgi:glycosyltransferase involved in cell wall biosynthesis
VWTYALELARGLASSGVEVLLATMGAPLSASQREEIESTANVRVAESGYKLEWMDDPWDDVRRSGEWLLDLERDFRPDVVHLNGYAHGSLPWSAPTLVGGHSCVLSWWRAVKGEPAPASWDRYRQAVTDGLRDADLVVAPTAAMLSALAHDYGPLPPSRVIPNGRDAAPFRAAAAAGRAKEPIILAAGRLWDEAKNVAALGRVAPRLAWPVYVAGEDQHPNGTAAAPQGVRMLGKLPPAELAGWLGRAAIYALPARYEPFGLSALEAAFAGCALVLGDIPSLREVWGDAAAFVPPDDAEALRATLTALADDGARRQALAERAQGRARRYTPRAMADGYFDAYRGLMDGRAADQSREGRDALA